jgi:nitrate/nitrite transport system substrate-binding protein
MRKEMGLTPPDPAKKTIVVMGKACDPAKPNEYVDSFAIKRS